MLKIQVGSGLNLMEGWDNFDLDVDIREPLPWATGSVDFIFAEHVIEHIDMAQGVRFLAECRRVLAPCGVARIAFPDVERISRLSPEELGSYLQHLARVVPGVTTRAQAIQLALTGWGHKAAWTVSLAFIVLTALDFAEVGQASYGLSLYPELVGVEAHHKTAGPAAVLETSIVEGRVAPL